MRASQSDTWPNTAFGCQRLPPIYNEIKMIGSLYKNVGRKSISPSIRVVRMITFSNAKMPAFLIAEMQECRNDYKNESLLDKKQISLIDRTLAGNHVEWKSFRIRFRKEDNLAG